MTTKKALPHFVSPEKESDFWDSHSTTEFASEEVSVRDVIAEGADVEFKGIVKSADTIAAEREFQWNR